MSKLTLKAFMSYVASNPIAFDDFTADEVSAWAHKQVEAIETQYARRAVKRSEKRASENSDLSSAVLDMLSETPMTLAAISSALADAGVTASVQKLAPLMKALAENGQVKRYLKDKRVAYSL